MSYILPKDCQIWTHS